MFHLNPNYDKDIYTFVDVDECGRQALCAGYVYGNVSASVSRISSQWFHG
ncbi:hypothetical protein MARINOS108_90039 [Marinoscillum sp. 108]|nr:hypothetical protein MARINOS108_90039 [Marinoscillum sp. 108]